jgi:hypothetical protein
MVRPGNATIVVDGRYEIMYSHMLVPSEGQDFVEMVDAHYERA